MRALLLLLAAMLAAGPAAATGYGSDTHLSHQVVLPGGQQCGKDAECLEAGAAAMPRAGFDDATLAAWACSPFTGFWALHVVPGQGVADGAVAGAAGCANADPQGFASFDLALFAGHAAAPAGAPPRFDVLHAQGGVDAQEPRAGGRVEGPLLRGTPAASYAHASADASPGGAEACASMATPAGAAGAPPGPACPPVVPECSDGVDNDGDGLVDHDGGHDAAGQPDPGCGGDPHGKEGLAWSVNPTNGHAYALTPPMPWWDAEALAVAEGGHLVTLDDGAEEGWVRGQFGTHEHFWTGFNDLASEGAWAWSSGAAAAYTNWCSGEPNNNAGGEHAAVLNWSHTIGEFGDCWNDLPPDGALRGVVEVP